jgi:hypothetical protein
LIGSAGIPALPFASLPDTLWKRALLSPGLLLESLQWA